MVGARALMQVVEENHAILRKNPHAICPHCGLVFRMWWHAFIWYRSHGRTPGERVMKPSDIEDDTFESEGNEDGGVTDSEEEYDSEYDN